MGKGQNCKNQNIEKPKKNIKKVSKHQIIKSIKKSDQNIKMDKDQNIKIDKDQNIEFDKDQNVESS